MRIAPTTISTAALSSLATLSATLLVLTVAPNALRERALSSEQRAQVASIVKDQVNELSDRLTRAAREQGLSDGQRSEVASIARELLKTNPEVIQEALTEMIRKRLPPNLPANAAKSPAAASDKAALIKDNAAALFSSPHQVAIGNRQGDVTLVEFFDYNCGYCKRALSDTIELLKSDSQLRIVLKEFPILGQGSLEAAKVGIAVRMQDSTGTKYLVFHQKLLSSSTPADKASALAVAKDLGFDVNRLENDMESDEARLTLDENMTLARTIGVNGTPGYVIGDTVVPGAVGEAVLKQDILAVRTQRKG